MIDDALTAHFSTLMQVAGASMKYSRLAESFTAKMVLARRRQDVEEMQKSASLSAKIVDLLVRQSDFKLGEPQRGDRIEMLTGRVFEVRSQPNLPCWEWSDPRQTFMRIHTVEQQAVTPSAMTIDLFDPIAEQTSQEFRFHLKYTPSTGAVLTSARWTLTGIRADAIVIEMINGVVTVTDPSTAEPRLDVADIDGAFDQFSFPYAAVLSGKLPTTMTAELQITDSAGATRSDTKPIQIVTYIP